MTSIFLPLIRNGPTDPTKPIEPELPVEPTSMQEAEFAYLLMTSQHRPVLHRNEILMRVAQERVDDMVARNYFSHTNPDGFGANYLVRQAGYNLPDWYSHEDAANNIECIAAGYATGSIAWAALMESPGHKAALIGALDFYKEQDEYGVGHCHAPDSTYGYYWAIIIATH